MSYRNSFCLYAFAYIQHCVFVLHVLYVMLCVELTGQKHISDIIVVKLQLWIKKANNLDAFVISLICFKFKVLRQGYLCGEKMK